MQSEASGTPESCPHCGGPAPELIQIDAGMRLALQTTEGGAGLPQRVCGTCYNDLTGRVSRGVKLRLEKQAQAKNKAMMWKSRVSLVKKARALMGQKSYPEAAVNYEKYIRVLEMAHDLGKGDLNPDIFSKSKHSKEMTVVATAYWDLMRIYDTSSSYRDRMGDAAKKLAAFAPYSPLYPDIIGKAEAFVKSAKNPDIVRGFLRLSRRNRPRCFIATTVFEYPGHPTIVALRQWRDQQLKISKTGRRLVCLYYRHSRRFIPWLQRSIFVKGLLKLVLTFIARISQKFS